MPHSISPASSPTSDDSILQDAPAENEVVQEQRHQKDGETPQSTESEKTKLEDMFGDDDDEFASSMDVDDSSQPAMQVQSTTVENDF